MAKFPVYDRAGKEVGTYQVQSTDIAPRISTQLLHDAVVMYQSNQRQGSFRTKNRGEVSGSTKKMYRQKGTGNARAGSRRSGIRRGGGHIFARRPRDFSYRLPRKALRMATRMAIASKIRDEEIVLVDDLSLSEPKTRIVASALVSLGCHEKRLLLITTRYDPTLYKAARNIQGVTVMPAAEVNALAVLNCHRILLTPDAMDTLKQGAASAKDN